ncbi:hypothetical protein [Kamptonema sp. UHCC 0994]|uniref:hypothetical protein n=1 Tax=Kamptonema sp. UHCC 0994 TaxID=3031329 RepID=UPI0023B9C45F|nr:hypothetical protein [Kamptonema sp. UHCC 0994]MDF0551684.1 hypothetical protein [Kamptonema sp. UHCC 0994]
MASKTLPPPGQLSLFDIGKYEQVLQHYDIEDGYEEDESWPPKLVSESIEEFVSESNWPPDPIDDSLTNDSLTTAQPCGVVNKYHAGGSARGGGEYWRFSYRVGKRVKHVHIPGGHSMSLMASNRADEVRDAIAAGSSTAEVLKLIGSWTKKNR